MNDNRDAAIEVEVEEPDPFELFASESALVATPAATVSEVALVPTLSHALVPTLSEKALVPILVRLSLARRRISTLRRLPFRTPGRAALQLRMSIFGCGVAAGVLLANAVSRDGVTPIAAELRQPAHVAPPSNVRVWPIAALAAATPADVAPTIAQPAAAKSAAEVLTKASAAPARRRVAAAPPARTRTAAAAAPAKRQLPAGRRGTLVVESNPPGGRVFINSEFAGLTPLVVRALPSGSRAVGVRLDGYTSWSRGVSIVANRSTKVVAQLTRSRLVDSAN